jgi:periodic tryptophan protein 2
MFVLSSFLVMFCRSGGSEAVKIFSKDLRRIPVLKDDSFDDLVEVIAVDDMRQGLRYIISY